MDDLAVAQLCCVEKCKPHAWSRVRKRRAGAGSVDDGLCLPGYDAMYQSVIQILLTSDAHVHGALLQSAEE